MKLDSFGILTVDQLRKMNVAGLGDSGRRNALRILGEMERDGLICSKHVGKKLFALPGSKFGNWEHRELVVSYLIVKGYWRDAVIERPVLSGGKEVIKPDAIVGSGSDFLCVEVDRRQSKSANLGKVKIYKETGLRVVFVCYKGRSGHFPGMVKEYIEELNIP